MKPELQLTERQRAMLALLARGHDNPEIAEQLQIAERTVQNEVSNIIKALSVNSRAQAVAMYLRPMLDVREAGRPMINLDRVPTYAKVEGIELCRSCGAPTEHVKVEREERRLQLHACEACMAAFLVEV